ncbi:DUF6265 family protein [Sphingobacterium anhuiense]|uniref:DUF6265 family protein n=1 Tax=Sphingobacterium anhuiense TaxID=493780 RepID=A0ABW5YR18_9SPHI
MKPVLLCIMWLASIASYGQSKLPLFLVGTWKINSTEQYEHWDQLNESTMKGFSYQMKHGQIIVSEYLELNQVKKGITFIASVLNQNNGKSVPFIFMEKKEGYTFENPNHDYPKQIVYTKIFKNEVQVTVSDMKQKTSTYRIYRQHLNP